MIRNYVETALRGMFTHKLFSIINLFGLAIGLASCLLIALFVRHELSYDRHYADAERIFRVTRETYPVTGNAFRPATNSGPAAALLVEDLAEVEAAGRLHAQRTLVRRDGTSFYEDDFRYVDSGFVDIFDFNWVQGAPDSALDEPLSIVLTRSLAEKYFGQANPLGETLMIEHDFPLQVSGVIEDLPANTHLSGTAFAPLALLEQHEELRKNPPIENWNMFNTYTYIRAVPGTTAATIQSQLPDFVSRHVGDSEYGARNEMTVTPLTAIHLSPGRVGELKRSGSLVTVIAFTTIAIGILLMACVNFMNLATARSAQRAREIGVRKSLGAQRLQLIRQFIGESIMVVALAMLLALAIVEAAQPAFGSLMGADIGFSLLEEPGTIALLVALVMVVGCIAGSYPALYLSAFKATKVFKGEATRGHAGAVFRNILVVLQFSVAILLLICTGVVASQLRFAAETDLGFTTERIVVLVNTEPGGLGERWGAFRRSLEEYPEILGVTASSQGSALNPLASSTSIRPQGSGQAEVFVPTQNVDYDFFETYGIEVLAGRVFSPEQQAAGIVINELLARQYGWSPQEAVGQVLEGLYLDAQPVLGVVETALHHSISAAAQPYFYSLVPPQGPFSNGFGHIAISVSGRNMADTLAHIDRSWQEFAPSQPLSRHFLDDVRGALFESEQRQGHLFTSFSGLAIIIACLGLLGLAIFNAERRTKEIGVRKVVGGSVWSIVLLLTNDFSKLVLISNVIAWPLAYIAMNRWLENFAYRIELTPLIFIGSGLIALCIAWITVGGTAAKAASAKPVLALRYE